jgi:hypothetical protein
MVLLSVLSVDVADARDDRRQLVVRTYDTFGVSPSERETATTTAREILRDVAVDVIWRNCAVAAVEPACDAPLAPRELSVQFVRSPDAETWAVLGNSLVDVSNQGGSLCRIFVDRVHNLAASAGVDRGTLLGRAMAHEVGHLLLGTNEHSRYGLMRPRWNAAELTRDGVDWTVSRAQGKRMRRGLAARNRS